MTNDPKVSVIIPTYNVANYIEKCLECICNQTYKNLEIIICDDCSKDNTVEIIKKYMEQDNRIIFMQNEKNLKSGATRNRCIEKSTGDYILIQDADDYSKPDRVEKEVSFLEENPNFSFVGSGIYRFDQSGVWGDSVLSQKAPSNKDFLWGAPFIHPTCLFKKEALAKIDGYRVAKDTIRNEDFDLFVRLYENGFYGYNLQDKLLYYNENLDNYKRRKYRFRVDEFKIRLKAFKTLKLMPKGYLYALKPLIVGLVPRRIQYLLKKNSRNKTK